MWKVMLADDEPYVREGMEKLIPWKALGCEVTFQARNGRELVERMETERPDIIIVDIKMPVMGGLEVAAYVEEKGWPVKVILLTAYSDFEYARQALRYKVTDYVVKTSALDELPGILERVAGELQGDQPAVYRLILLHGLGERGGALERIVRSCFERETYTCSAAGETGYYILLANSALTQEELADSCGKLQDMAESFLGQKPRVCISRVYRDAGETARVYDRTLAYLLDCGADRRGDVLFAQGDAEERPAEDGWEPLPEDADLVERTQRLIERQFCSRLTLVGVAEQVHANPSYLSRLYKQRTGENLFDAMNRMRIEKAKEYIARQNRRIYEIAELVGFDDTAYFSRVFKKFTGISPSEYERRCRARPAQPGKECPGEPDGREEG